jgi:chloramphenicol O-acetyltransferase
MPIWIHEFILSMTDQIWYTYDKDESTQPPWAKEVKTFVVCWHYYKEF